MKVKAMDVVHYANLSLQKENKSTMIRTQLEVCQIKSLAK